MLKEKKLLVIGHSLVIDTNRKFWSVFAKQNNVHTDLIAPASWKSNLQSHIPFKANPYTDDGIKNIFTCDVINKGNGSLYFHSPLSLFRIFKKNEYNFIFVNQETWALSTLLIVFMKFISGNNKAKLYLCVAQNIRKEKLRILHPYEQFISTFITGFLYCSEGVKDVLRWKGIRTPCFYFPLPFDAGEFKALPSGSSPDVFRIGYLGRLTEDKGIEILLNACDKLKEKGFKYKLIVGGKGPLESKLRQRTDVEFLGLIPHNEAHRFYQKIDCFILPSQTLPHWKEQFGRVITESFATGRPLIGSDSGSIPEVLGKLEWNWLFPEKSSEDLANKIMELGNYLSTEEGKKHLNHSVQKNVELFSHESVATYLSGIFQSKA